MSDDPLIQNHTRDQIMAMFTLAGAFAGGGTTGQAAYQQAQPDQMDLKKLREEREKNAKEAKEKAQTQAILQP